MSSPPFMIVQGALIFGQVLFGLGSVIAALGLPACNPFAFALYREIAAGAILWTWSMLNQGGGHHDGNKKNESSLSSSSSSSSPMTISTTTLSWMTDWKRFVFLGLAIFGNQAGMIAGIKLAGPVTAAVWQPSQPIMTAAISMLLHWEPPNRRRIAGVILSFIGCAAMVVYSANKQKRKIHQEDDESNDNHENDGSLKLIVGNMLFFINCLSTSFYVIFSKEPLRRYPPLTVAAWSYIIAAAFMALTALSMSPFILPVICPDCTGIWTIPQGAFFALFYFIIFNSVVAYAILTWANQYATGTLVMGYSVLQPVTAALLTALLHSMGIYPSCNTSTLSKSVPCLDPPGIAALFGMLGVLGGLALVIVSEPTKKELGGKPTSSYQQISQNEVEVTS